MGSTLASKGDYRNVRSSFSLILHSYLRSGEHADIVIKVGDDEYRMHKLVLCAQSKFFQKACRNFKVGSCEHEKRQFVLADALQEAETNVIELHHGEPEMLRNMIDWIRFGYYCDSTCRPLPQPWRSQDQQSGAPTEIYGSTGSNEHRSQTNTEDNDNVGSDEHLSQAMDEQNHVDVIAADGWPAGPWACDGVNRPTKCHHSLSFDVKMFALAGKQFIIKGDLRSNMT